MQNQKGLPLSVTSFEKMVKENYIYVDKTKELSHIVTKLGPFLLSRPRRFGKSTLVDTLDCFFSGKKELFKDTYIGKNNLCSNKSYKVLRFNFSLIRDKANNETFNNLFVRQIINVFKKANIDIFYHDNLTAAEIFSNALEQNHQNDFVLLIDEYDAPLTEALDDSLEFERRRADLSAFYSVLKDKIDYFKFVFITGVTKYSHVSIFSAFNNLIDLSLDPDFGAIVGYTKEELESNFSYYIENAAVALNQEENTNKYTYFSILNKLKQNYDGYSFDKKNKCHVFNPWSILNFLDKPQNGFEPYWANTGGAKPTLLVKYLNKVDSITNVNNWEKYLDLDYLHDIRDDELSLELESIDSKDFKLLPILYQAGYFCIKEAYGKSEWGIGIPNNEVKRAFSKIIIQTLASRVSSDFSTSLGYKLLKDFDNKDTESIKDKLNKLINNLSYEGISRFNEQVIEIF